MKHRHDWRLPRFTVELVASAMAQVMDWGVTLLSMPDEWKITKGAGVNVAVLDTGSGANHVDLRNAVMLQKDFTGSRNGAADVQGHGTWCQGAIGARDNDTGVVGIAPECTLFAGKVLGDNGSGSSQSVAAGIDWAVASKADVISMSLGSPQPDGAIQAAIQRAYAAGVIVCCAAGNSGPGNNTVEYPGKWPEVICVAAMNQSKQISQFSSRGPELDICAPGEKCVGLWLNNGVAVLSGTSMATPIVAGAVALLIAYRKAQGLPRMNPNQVFDAIRSSAIDIDAPGFDPNAGWGLVNPAKLLVGAPPPPSPGNDTITFSADAGLLSVQIVRKAS